MKYSDIPISGPEREIINEMNRNRYRRKVGIPLDTPVYKTCPRSAYRRFSNTNLILFRKKYQDKIDLINSVLLERIKEEKK